MFIMSLKATSINFKKLIPARFDVNLEEDYIVNSDLVLGEGGFGMVFVAKDQKQDNRLVAVKRMVNVPQEGEDTEELERNRKAFTEEIRIMRELDHPNICKLFESFQEGNNLYFVMEYCPGGDLLTHLKESDYLDEGIVATVMQQVGSALHYAHTQNIAHRDVKPENIVFTSKDTESWECKVIDWGLAEVFTGKSMRAAAGTFQYCAPEVLNPMRAYNNACDMWSLGVVTHLALSGKLPFEGPVEKMVQLAQRERYRLTGDVWDTISGDGKDFVANLLKADPVRRLTGMQVMRHPWIASARKKQRATGPPPAMMSVLTNLKQFRNQNLLLKLCTAAVAKQLDHGQLLEIHKVFRHLDTNGDGVLTIKELSAGFKALYGAESEDFINLQEAWGKLDMSGSGTIDYTEFCAAGLGMQMVKEMDSMTVAFKALDSENKGYLTSADLKQAMTSMEGSHGDPAERAATMLIQRLDKTGNDRADLDEWLNAWGQAWANRQSISSHITEVLPMDISESVKSTLTVETDGSGSAPWREDVDLGLPPKSTSELSTPFSLANHRSLSRGTNASRATTSTSRSQRTNASHATTFTARPRNVGNTYVELRQIAGLNTVIEEASQEGRDSWELTKVGA